MKPLCTVVFLLVLLTFGRQMPAPRAPDALEVVVMTLSVDIVPASATAALVRDADRPVYSLFPAREGEEPLSTEALLRGGRHGLKNARA